MKKLFKLMDAIVTVVILFACFAIWTPVAQAQSSPTTYGNLTIGTNLQTIAASSTVTANSTAIAVRKDRGLAILPRFSLAAADTSAGNITFTFQVSADGTNYTTTGPLTYAIASSGTNALVGYKLFTPSDINNVKWVRLSKIQNAATNVLQGVVVQYSYHN